MAVMTVRKAHAARGCAWHRALGASAGITACIAGVSSVSAAQPEKKPGTTILAIDFTGAGSMLVDKKDQALKEAITMLAARVRELPREVPGMDEIPAPILDTLLTLLTSPARLAVTFDPDRQPEGMFGAGVVMSFGPGEQDAVNQMHGTVGFALAQAGAAGEGEPSDKYTEMLEVPSPVGGVIRYGPRKAADGWRYELHAGAAPDPDSAFGILPAPMSGVTPVARAILDFRPVGPMLEQQLEAMGGPEGEELSRKLSGMGLIGPDAVRYTYQSGYTKDEQVGYMVVEGMKKHARTMGVRTEPLNDAVFAMIPSDATMAGVYQADLTPTIEMLEEALARTPNGAEGLANFTSATGVDPFEDILGCLGGTFGFYMSESTGGQLGSVIAFASLRDRARFEKAHHKLVGFANTMLASEEAARGYARIRTWKDGQTQMFSLAFPGLPVPVEATWALQGDWLVMGLMPQSTIAATRQIAGKGDKGLRSNAGFAAAIPADKAMNSFTFIDTPRLMKDGYQYMCLAGSAIANAARSPTNADREPGLVIPPLSELRVGARPMFRFTHWRGDDFVMESHADRSMLVNVCGGLGAAAPFFPVIGAAIGAAAGAEGNVGPRGMFDHLLPMLP